MSKIDWSKTTFEGARLEILKRMPKMTFAEKLQWLEDMSEVSDWIGSKTAKVNNAEASHVSGS